MSEIYKCKRCNLTFVGEEFETHVCTPTLTSVKEIEFDYYYFTKDKMGKETIVIKGMDGILYGFVKREKKASDKTPLSSCNDNIRV
jgi:hypothetical protein